MDTIAKKLNKTKDAIYIKANRLNITLYKHKRSWTQKEEMELAELWGNFTIETISKRLNRSIISLKVKAVRMGLGPMIRNNTDILTINDIIDILGVSRDKIMTWSKKGLPLKQKRITNNQRFYFVEWDDLITFLENNQDLWDSSNVDLYMLGEEYDWLKEKRKKDASDKPLMYRLWTREDIINAINYFKLGYSNKDIAKLLNRSERAVAKYLKNEGYNTRSRKWTEEDEAFLVNNYEEMTKKEIAKILHKNYSQIDYHVTKSGLKKIRTLKK